VIGETDLHWTEAASGFASPAARQAQRTTCAGSEKASNDIVFRNHKLTFGRAAHDILIRPIVIR
jgi:hypothetical protein